MRRAAAVSMIALTACSLAYGLYGNVAPSAPGCPPDAGVHAFCEFFDEAPAWPADASMTAVGAPVLVDAGCPSPPSCLAATGGSNFVARTVATPNGVHDLTYRLQARFDLVDSGVVPRVAWITLNGPTPTTFGITFAHDIDNDDYEVFMFGLQGDASDNLNVGPFALDVWYDLTLTIQLDTSSVALTSESLAASDQRDFVRDWSLTTLAPSSVTSVTVGGGIDTGVAHTAATIDSVTFDFD